MTPETRKLALTAHITVSVGWLGAVLCFLVLSVAAFVSADVERVRALYDAMELAGWAVLLPLALASLVTGLIQSLGTHWGLLRHYWVVAKLSMNLFAAVVLLLYMATFRDSTGTGPSTSVEELRDPSPVVHAGAAFGLLLTAVFLSVYKPRGVTRYGRRRRRAALETTS